MGAAYDDNFGFWSLDDPEERAFFAYVQRQSIRTICTRCGGTVRLLPSKILCAPCVAALECGAPSSMSEYAASEPKTAGRRVKTARKSRTIARRLAGAAPRPARAMGDDAAKADRIVGPGR